jgi:hypothetical protein
LNLLNNNGSVHPAYNPSFSAGTVFFSHNKSANSVFQPTYQHSRTEPISDEHLPCIKVVELDEIYEIL